MAAAFSFVPRKVTVYDTSTLQYRPLSISTSPFRPGTAISETSRCGAEYSVTQTDKSTVAEKTETTTANTSKRNENAVQSAYGLAQEHGYKGSLRDWITETTVERQKDTGKSVFQVAVDHGYKGTQKEWVDHIIQTDQTENTNGFISDIAVTDNGHIVITTDDGISIETDDVVTPTEPEQIAFTVTFLDVDGSVCRVQQVNKGKAAFAPTIEKAGFLGWRGNYINVQQDETVTAVYADSKNVFHIASAQGKPGDMVSVRVCLNGNVELCGLDMNLSYDPSLEIVSVNDEMDMDIVVNAYEPERIIRFNFSSAMNKKRAMDIMELTFRITGTNADAYGVQLSANAVKALVDNRVEDTDYTILNGVVYVHE